MYKKPEILAPAGSMDALKAAVRAGADAVYLGGNMFGARAYADNFDEPSLIEGIEYCHLYGVKVYLTVNTLFRNDELQKLYEYLKPYYLVGLDAVIVQDLGVMKYIHDVFPDLPIHASTQMTITTPYSYMLLKDYGVTRVVPGRELSNRELFAMKKRDFSPELEVFVQGALCYCYSGQCLMSSFIGGRSGNRGRCAQPCRLPYSVFQRDGNEISPKGEYLLSPKDLCGLSNVPQLINMGIDSFKIEGRMKKPLYVAACVRAYRKVVDAFFEHSLTEEMIKKYTLEMSYLFNRGGFTDGYYEQHNGRDMMSLKQPGNQGVFVGRVQGKNRYQIEILLNKPVHKGDLILLRGSKDGIQLTCNVESPANRTIMLNVPKIKSIEIGESVYCMQNAYLEQELTQFIKEDKKISLTGTLKLHKEQEAELTLQCGSHCIIQKGKLVAPAAKQPLVYDVVCEKISQLGDTRYELSNLNIELDSDVFYSMKDLKELRRQAIVHLEEDIIHSFYRKDGNAKKLSSGICRKEVQYTDNWSNPTVVISSMEQFQVLNSYENVKKVYLDLQYFSVEDIMTLIKEYRQYDYWILLPAVVRRESFKEIEQVKALDALQLKGLVVRNLDEYAYLKEQLYDKDIIADYSLYVMNKEAGWVIGGTVTLPVELNEKELIGLSRDLPQKQMYVYGYQQLMVSAQCVCNHTRGCNKGNTTLILRDRYHKEFYCRSVCKYCYSLIYNGLPTVLYDVVSDEVKQSGVSPILHFTMENKKQMKEVLDGFLYGNPFKGARTKGHFSRGVE